MIKLTAKRASLVTILVCAAMLIFGSQQRAFSLLITEAILIINFLGIAAAVWLVIRKKSIALIVTVIVLKYTIIAAAIWLCYKQEWFDVSSIFEAITIFVSCILISSLGRTKNAF